MAVAWITKNCSWELEVKGLLPVNLTISPLLNPCELKDNTADPDDAVGDSAILYYNGSTWVLLGSYGVAIA